MAYIWYSKATDITGQKLQEALGIDGGSEKPENEKVVIGWGAKTKKDVVFNEDVRVLNHPDQIRLNRNKLESSLRIMEELKDGDQDFVPRIVVADNILEAINEGVISYPMVGRTKYHQGGKGFWLCPTEAQVIAAVSSGAQYFQEMIPVKTEYRLHVFGDKVIHAVKKKQRTDKEFEEAFIEDELARQESLALKNGDDFDKEMVKKVITRQAKNATKGGPNQILKSNRLGWKFSIVKSYDSEMADIAIKAVKALGLDFGAVDCCLDINDKPWVFEINTGPGLEKTSFDKYVEAFKNALEKKPEKIKVSEPKKSAKSVLSGRRKLLSEQLVRLTKMVEEANDDEMELVQKMGAKLIFGENQ